jgi:hypothetical protein
MVVVIRTLAYAVLAVSAAGTVRVGLTLVLMRAGPRLSSAGTDLVWRIGALKLSAIALTLTALTIDAAK